MVGCEVATQAVGKTLVE